MDGSVARNTCPISCISSGLRLYSPLSYPNPRTISAFPASRISSIAPDGPDYSAHLGRPYSALD